MPAKVGKALSFGLQHRNALGLKLLHTAEERIQQRGSPDGEGIYKVCQAYAALGDEASALRMLGLSIHGGFFPYPYFQSDPLLNPIRKQPEFARLLDEARRSYEQFRATFAAVPH